MKGSGAIGQKPGIVGDESAILYIEDNSSEYRYRRPNGARRLVKHTRCMPWLLSHLAGQFHARLLHGLRGQTALVVVGAGLPCCRFAVEGTRNCSLSPSLSLGAWRVVCSGDVCSGEVCSGEVCSGEVCSGVVTDTKPDDGARRAV